MLNCTYNFLFKIINGKFYINNNKTYRPCNFLQFSFIYQPPLSNCIIELKLVIVIDVYVYDQGSFVIIYFITR